MIRTKRYLKGVLNADGSFFAILPDEHVNAVNMRRGSAPSADSSTDDWEAVGSTVWIPNSLPLGVNIGLGGCWDEVNNRLIWLNWNDGGLDGIYVYDIDANQVYTALLSANVTGGLNLSKYSCIHSCFAVNHNFYWVDSTTNEPRRFNIEAGIKAYQPGYVTTFAPYSLPVAQSVIAWIRRPPGLPVHISKNADNTFVNNFIANNAFEFMYRYQYRDYELSTLSAYSLLAPYNDNGDTTTNFITAIIPFSEKIEQDVLQVDLVAKYYNENKYFIIKSWNKNVPAEAAQIAAHNAGTTALSYNFYNNQIGLALEDAYSVKPFDSVPIFAQTTAAAKNRAFLSNYTTGYNTPVASSLSASPVNTAAVGLVITATFSALAKITNVKIGGASVVYVSNSPFPVGFAQLGYFSTTNTGTQTVVVSVVGPCLNVQVRYGPPGGPFTPVIQAYTGDGDYTFPGIPINPNDGQTVNLTWEAAISDFS